MSGWGMSVSGLDAAVDLLGQIKINFDGEAVYMVGPTVKYAVHHEYGSSKMGARPFARPAANMVQANMASEVERIATSQNISLDNEENIVRCAALAVQDRMRRIADAKDIRDTGQLISSIRVEEQ